MASRLLEYSTEIQADYLKPYVNNKSSELFVYLSEFRNITTRSCNYSVLYRTDENDIFVWV